MLRCGAWVGCLFHAGSGPSFLRGRIRQFKAHHADGKVTKVEWYNPHAFFYIDVKDEKTGAVTNWAAEMNSPNSLMRLGWTRDSMKLEDVVTVQGSLAKDGSKLLNARSVVLTKTGQRLFAGSSEPAPPRQVGIRGQAPRNPEHLTIETQRTEKKP